MVCSQESLPAGDPQSVPPYLSVWDGNTDPWGQQGRPVGLRAAEKQSGVRLRMSVHSGQLILYRREIHEGHQRLPAHPL